jgi:hypothetical protein
MIRRSIPGWEGRYTAGQDGRIYGETRKRGTIFQELGKRWGRYQVKLWRNGVVKTAKVEVLVCLAFHGARPVGYDVSHLDGIKTNNRPDNLRWETRSQNHMRMFGHGTGDRGVSNSRASVSPEQVLAIRAEAAAGISYSFLMNQYAVSRATISRIVTRRRYWEV